VRWSREVIESNNVSIHTEEDVAGSSVAGAGAIGCHGDRPVSVYDGRKGKAQVAPDLMVTVPVGRVSELAGRAKCIKA